MQHEIEIKYKWFKTKRVPSFHPQIPWAVARRTTSQPVNRAYKDTHQLQTKHNQNAKLSSNPTLLSSTSVFTQTVHALPDKGVTSNSTPAIYLNYRSQKSQVK